MNNIQQVMGDRYTLAHDSKYNVGDFLIRDRAVALLKNHRDIAPTDLHSVDISHTTISDKELEEISETDALLIAGGPSTQPSFYPRIYPWMDRILDLDIPYCAVRPGVEKP
jgi:hypothetical protein